MLLNRLTRTSTITTPSRLLRPTTSFVNNFALSQSSLRLRATANMSTFGQNNAAQSPTDNTLSGTVTDTTVSEELISKAIMTDHREIEKSYDNIRNAADDDERARWQNHFVWELARHSVAEELVLYPAFEKYLGEKGQNMAAQDRSEHQQVKEILKHFETIRTDHPEFIPTITQLMDNLKEHIKGEEEQDLPTLENVLTAEESVQLARKFARRKVFAPTRAHAWAGSEGGVFETAAGLLAAPMDHLADIFRKQPDSISPNPSSK